MKSAYNYTIVETHKQKIFIPYLGLEFSGWTMLICMLVGVLLGTSVLGTIFALILGEFGYIFALGVTALIEVVIVTFVTEIDRESGKNKLITFYYTTFKKYHLIYDSKGQKHYLSGKKEGVIYRVR